MNWLFLYSSSEKNIRKYHWSLYCTVSSFSVFLKAIIVKLIYAFEIPTLHILLLRMLFALPFYVVILLLKKSEEKEKPQKVHYLWLFVFGAMGYYIASFLDFYGLRYLSASLERIILFVYPTLVVLIGAVCLKTKITKQQLLAILITYLGVFLTFASELQINRDEHLLLGAGLIFLSALTYASYLVGSGWLMPKFGAVRFYLFGHDNRLLFCGNTLFANR